MLIHGWGRYPIIEAAAHFPTTRAAATAALSEFADGSLIARGMGRSYGDSALNPRVLATKYLNLLLGFEQNEGLIRCASGVTLADLLAVIVPRGWFLPATPGTRFVSVGGAIASDVHGKNHHLHGCFSECVDSLDLLLATGDIVTCSRSRHPDLFQATCGGMGLTGVILEATLRLKPVASAFIDQTTYKARNLAEAFALFEANGASTYSVAWIDCQATGGRMGRSLVMLGEHSPNGGLALREKIPLSIPFDMPAPLLNRFSVKAFNTLYYQRVRRRQERQQVHFEPFFYPLDGIHHWNRLYGKRGFTQYQFVLPTAAGLKGMGRVMEKIAASRRGSFLAVLKALGRENANFLSFPMEGYTVALDFKIADGLFELLEEMDAIVMDHGGRVYLAKDARMSEKTFKDSYPRWQAFQEVRARHGALGKFSSSQSRRLGLD